MFNRDYFAVVYFDETYFPVGIRALDCYLEELFACEDTRDGSIFCTTSRKMTPKKSINGAYLPAITVCQLKTGRA